jgi:hypothetical protein
VVVAAAGLLPTTGLLLGWGLDPSPFRFMLLLALVSALDSALALAPVLVRARRCLHLPLVLLTAFSASPLSAPAVSCDDASTPTSDALAPAPAPAAESEMETCGGGSGVSPSLSDDVESIDILYAQWCQIGTMADSK